MPTKIGDYNEVIFWHNFRFVIIVVKIYSLTDVLLALKIEPGKDIRVFGISNKHQCHAYATVSPK